MIGTPPHAHQSAPLVLINGRSGIFSGSCSSESTTGLLLDHLRHAHHMTGEHLTYPRTHAYHWWSKKYRAQVAESLHSQIDRMSGGLQVDVIAHSQGCDAVREVMDHCPRQLFRRIVFLAPAMERRVKWHRRRFDKTLVMRNPRDGALLAGGLLPGHSYGTAGRDGFITSDPRITQVIVPGDASLDWMGHNHYFRGATLYAVGARIEEFLCA